MAKINTVDLSYGRREVKNSSPDSASIFKIGVTGSEFNS
jgi:hypothetical protein